MKMVSEMMLLSVMITILLVVLEGCVVMEGPDICDTHKCLEGFLGTDLLCRRWSRSGAALRAPHFAPFSLKYRTTTRNKGRTREIAKNHFGLELGVAGKHQSA